MRTVVAGLVIGLAACDGAYDPDPPAGPIDVRLGPAARGTSFTCSGAWPSTINPCSGAPHLEVHADADASTLTIVATPWTVDGGDSSVAFELALDGGAVTSVTAVEWTMRVNAGGLFERSNPRGGFFEPISVAPDGVGRNAARFELRFAWGTFAGTYDTAAK